MSGGGIKGSRDCRTWRPDGLVVPLLLLLATCGGRTEEPELLEPIQVIANQNAGTTFFLNARGLSPLRPLCDDFYCCDLCSVDTEALIATAIAEEAPDVIMFEELWDQRRCGDPEMPDEAWDAPYACSAGAGHQITRLLGEEYDFACAEGVRDCLTCIAYRQAVFRPQTADGEDVDCPDRDCSSLLEVIRSQECPSEGKVAFLRGRTHYGPTILIVVHPWGGFFEDDHLCQAQQLAAAEAVMAELPPEAMLIAAGDFNVDPVREEGVHVDAVNSLLATLGVEKLNDDTVTHLLIDLSIDMIHARGWPSTGTADCTLRFLDKDTAAPMLDHAFIVCRSQVPTD
jgi:hypothetical protein